MNEKLKNFYNQQSTPWMKLFYRLIYTQLPEMSGKRILDFGAGFGWTANHLAGLGNEVLAIEPNAEMVEMRASENSYEMWIGDLETLKSLPAASFDAIICHNVFEYVAPNERAAILQEFKRLMKLDGLISIVKHNFAGSILQRVVFENALDEAYALLTGEALHDGSFGEIHTYDLPESVARLGLEALNTYGIRTFFGIQPNAFKTAPDWEDNMYKIEMEVAENPDYNSISFFHHVILKNKKKV
ncbi:MAG: class I SAM-dependent methyltransferase [Streptococcaceae bacterium]|jgi:SAM-dependent methyltransferase|nr:class I SAM-dependent methyltransferase [Streptococcaceae bacterium]